MFHIVPYYGSFSMARKYYCTTDENNVNCQDVLKFVNLNKLGNDNGNFAAVLINGHDDDRVGHQLCQKIDHELNSELFCQAVSDKNINGYIETILAQFEATFLSSMADLHHQKECKHRKISDLENADKNDPLYKDVADLQNQLKSGATVAIIAIIHGVIYVFNIGDNQIILTSKDDTAIYDNKHKYILLTDEQSFCNDKEIQRIKEECGLDHDALRWLSTLSTEKCHSRCIGDYEYKCNYPTYDCLRKATSSPFKSTPQESQCIPLDMNYTHLLLVSSGLFYLVRDLIYDHDKVHGHISNKFFEFKSVDPTTSLEELCKMVVDAFVAEHKLCHDECQSLIEEACQLVEYARHDDLSLFAIELNLSQQLAHVVREVDNGFVLLDSVDSATDKEIDSVDDSVVEPLTIRKRCHASLTPVSAYVDLSQWTKAEKKLTESELSFIDSIVYAAIGREEPIVEEMEK